MLIKCVDIDQETFKFKLLKTGSIISIRNFAGLIGVSYNKHKEYFFDQEKKSDSDYETIIKILKREKIDVKTFNIEKILLKIDKINLDIMFKIKPIGMITIDYVNYNNSTIFKDNGSDYSFEDVNKKINISHRKDKLKDFI